MLSDGTRTPERDDDLKPGSRAAGLFRRAIRILGLAVIICGLTAAGIIAYLCIASPTIRDTVGILISKTGAWEKTFAGRDKINILLMGRDLDRDPDGRIVHTRGRTDAMVLAHVDFRNRSVNILSIPRDTLVHIPGYREKRRISYANAFGGPELARDTVEEFLGVHPDYYLLANFAAFEKAIDAIGGLEITVDKKLDYDDNWGNLHIHLEPGKQVLNGKQVMGFVRYRRSNNGSAESDLARIGRQQEFLRAAGEKLCTASAMFRLPKVLDTIRNDIESNLTPAQMMCLARFLRCLPPESNIRMETLPTLEEGRVFVHADLDATREVVRQMFLDNQ